VVMGVTHCVAGMRGSKKKGEKGESIEPYRQKGLASLDARGCDYFKRGPRGKGSLARREEKHRSQGVPEKGGGRFLV